MKPTFSDEEISCSVINEEYIQLQLGEQRCTLDYSQLMDFLLGLSTAAAIMENKLKAEDSLVKEVSLKFDFH